MAWFHLNSGTARSPSIQPIQALSYIGLKTKLKRSHTQKPPVAHFPLDSLLELLLLFSFHPTLQLTTTKEGAELPSNINCGKYQGWESKKLLNQSLFAASSNKYLFDTLEWLITHPTPAKKSQPPRDLSCQRVHSFKGQTQSQNWLV